MARILIVDDDEALRRTLGDRLRFWNHAVDEAPDVATGLQAARTGAHELVLLDLSLPDGSGLDVLRALREEPDDARDVIVLTAHGSIETAVEAIRAGATDFLLKPADFELLRLVVDRTLERRRLEAVNRALARREAETGDLVSVSPAMAPLLATAAQAARSNATILLTGENGTGKQKMAEFIHRNSDRADGPFVYVNCVAISDELVESTLFGHEKGAFTGALSRKEGLLEDAEGGTAFLDEIGDVSPRVQAKLLHFLESGDFQRVGGRRTLHVDGRIVAATNRDLPAAIREGRFREDLYFRLNVIQLRLPPLRERREDIPVLAERFVDRFAQDLKRKRPALAPATRARLVAHAWPGNVRELKNAIERMVVLATGDTLTPDLLPAEVAGDAIESTVSPPGSASDPTPPAHDPYDLREAVEIFRRAHIARVLAHCGGNRTRAAARLGVQRTHLSLLLRHYGLAGATAGEDAEALPPA
jgi:DNA-binding NtrC family response regulator